MVWSWAANVAEILGSIKSTFESRREKLQAGSLLELVTSSLELCSNLLTGGLSIILIAAKVFAQQTNWIMRFLYLK